MCSVRKYFLCFLNLLSDYCTGCTFVLNLEAGYSSKINFNGIQTEVSLPWWLNYKSKTYVLQIVEDPEHTYEHFSYWNASTSELKMIAQQDIGSNKGIANQKCM